ncbi:MAG: MoxR family ATPase [Acidimicrobiales bacterium]|nr:ATPase [Acidimicrobiaceae bacterium]MDP6162722.1 MoxR family ATPase [Acidimicrobiales bacterium]HJL90904.1 MoxR family ATPase [Acidimicrobiales bacterium]HJO41542.1 MoxR family ATPase [Acidimicrobiales bacterium]
MGLRDVSSVEKVVEELSAQNYLADRGLATAVFLSLRQNRPLLLEGEAGVGKTELAKSLSNWVEGDLIRLQCYEGIDSNQAVYEWDYARQLLHLRTAEASGRAEDVSTDTLEGELYDERFLIRRPLLQALSVKNDPPPVLLIDEIDRADDEFEAFLLEILSEYSITIPELGTYRSEVKPIVVITSNRTRDLHDALKRRCFYHWVEHPDVEREIEIIRIRAPKVPLLLAEEVSKAAALLRGMDLYKPPGVAETIDWAEALVTIGVDDLDEDSVDETLGTLIKYREDQERVRSRGFDEILSLVRQG